MLRDRGKIKWQSAFFMPEHVKMLKQLRYDEMKQKKPSLDEQELEEIGLVVMDSFNDKIPIKITTWEDGFFKECTGVVSKVDMFTKQVKFTSENREHHIQINSITAVEKV